MPSSTVPIPSRSSLHGTHHANDLNDADDAVVLTVANHGPAIPAEVLPTIVHPFPHRAAGTTARTGLGLKLSIASEIVHAHGGTIQVASTVREGTTFTVRWPRK